MNLSHRAFARCLAAACALSAIASHAAQPVRVLERLGGALQRVEPAADGTLGVVSADTVAVVARAGNAGWRSQAIAVADDPRMFASAWMAGGRWWLVRQDSLDTEHTVWNLTLLGPVQATGGKPKPAPVTATLARRCPSISPDQVVRDPRAGRALVLLAGGQDGDRSALRAFDEHGASDARFDAAAAGVLGALGPAAATAAAAGGWWVAATDGAGIHERATLLGLRADGAAATGFGAAGHVTVELSAGSGLPDDALVRVLHLLDDGAGSLWAAVREQDGRRGTSRPSPSGRDELRAFSTATGKRLAEAEPPLPLTQELWSDAAASERTWSGFVRNAASPTLCVAASRATAHAWALRCIVRRGDGWQSIGEPGLLAGVDSVGDVVADPRDPGQLLIGADEGRRGVTLYAWKP